MKQRQTSGYTLIKKNAAPKRTQRKTWTGSHSTTKSRGCNCGGARIRKNK
ncbi:hypothetical protein SAMN05421736_101567 [Evansella caseinilytica]|uniref:Uncharacterized protein n=1 Tax=Evansella caseinilytica TaxID=1503961 RepID=A0A1H3HP92_9BACI|nr:hypothetical protein SAMN05421736_101567 [Evansella caseinilytica]